MKKIPILILYSLPSPLFADGSVDNISQPSVLSRLQAVQEALQSLGHPVQTLEAGEEITALISNILSARTDLVFNLCEEFLGRAQLEMHIAALLELLDIPFTGSSALGLGLSQDKGKTNSILTHQGIQTPAFQICSPGQDDFALRLPFPLIVKPIREDASLGIDPDALVQDLKAFNPQVQKIHQLYGQPALVEQFIDGRELNVSILGNQDLQVLPISEIDFSTMPPGLPRICSYAAKWIESSEEFAHAIPSCPAVLSPEVGKKVIDAALRAFRVMELRDYARVDIRLDSDEVPYVLEVNANPDISVDAGMTRSAKTAGLSYPEFIQRIVELAHARRTSWKSRGRARKPPPKKVSRA
jgi:D-alanine-D-alanine ligase